MITMTDYRAQASKLEPRLCSKHTRVLYSLGCRSCLDLFCAECVGGLKGCADGEHNRLKFQCIIFCC